MNIYKIYTLDAGAVEGAMVETLVLKNGTKIPAITVGDTGRGRSLGVLAVHLPKDLYAEWLEQGKVRVYAGRLGKTKSGNVKLFAEKEATTDEKIIAVMPTKIGFRGSNFHTGDRIQEYWVRDGWNNSDYEAAGIPVQDSYTREEVEEYSQLFVAHKYKSGDYRWDAGFKRKITFADFPGEILVKGIIAQGDAGGMGSGDQVIALIPKDTWFRTSYSGRLYGAPSSHYYRWGSEKMTCVTWEERQLLEEANDDDLEWL